MKVPFIGPDGETHTFDPQKILMALATGEIEAKGRSLGGRYASPEMIAEMEEFAGAMLLSWFQSLGDGLRQDEGFTEMADWLLVPERTAAEVVAWVKEMGERWFSPEDGQHRRQVPK